MHSNLSNIKEIRLKLNIVSLNQDGFFRTQIFNTFYLIQNGPLI